MRKRPVLGTIADLAVAVLLAATAAGLYRSFVFSEFVPIRVEVVSTEVYPSGHAVPIALPDLSALRGHTTVVGVRLRNTGSQERRVGLLVDGLPRNRVVLPPNGTIRRDVVVDDVPRSLEVIGDADAWGLSALDIRNYHLRSGDYLMAVALPERADAYTPAKGLLPVAIALSILALANALVPRTPRRSLRLMSTGLALTAFLVVVACLLLPLMSPYKVLLSRSVFWLVAGALFSPALIYPFHAAPTLVGGLSRGWRRHEVTYERGASLLGLAAIAIAQPIFEVLSNSPEFFAARGTPPATAVASVLAIGLGIPLVLIGIERAIRVLSRLAAAAFLGIVLALLSAAVVMPWFQRSEAVPSPWDAVISACIGAAVALAYFRFRVTRQFLTALSPAALIVPAVFLLNPDVRQNFLPSESAAAVQAIERTPPIVLVIFDELPLNSLLTVGGNIDAEQYPNFAALAREAYWFRNASTVSYTTSYAVPAILSGRYPTTINAVPTLRYYPVNLFTTLARHYDIFAALRFQQLCPPRACQHNAARPADSVRSLLSDLGLVWLHMVLPQALTDELPPVVEDWADFGQTREALAGDVRQGRAGTFAQFVSSIDDRPARLYFIHSMLPHMSFEYVPSGRRYRGPELETRVFRRTQLFQGVSAAYADTLHQRHLAQVGFVDRLVGDLISRLRQTGVYDKSLVIITADHGASYREGRQRRRPQQNNLADVLQVPLLVKLPGQRRGEVVDRNVETVDILPTILDIVGATASLRLDGRSAIDSQAPERSSRTYILRNRLNVARRTVGDLSEDRAGSLERKARRFGSGDPMGLYAPPAARHLLGTNVSRSTMHPVPDVEITIRDRRQYAAVRRNRDPLPLYVRGALTTSRSDPLTVAVVVNGSVAAVTHSYRDRGNHVFGTLIPEAALRDGNNTVTAMVLEGSP